MQAQASLILFISNYTPFRQEKSRNQERDMLEWLYIHH
jgi:hypothetical protein